MSVEPSPASKRPRSSSAHLVEEIVEVEETQHVLMRFPCFDFFRNVNLCETASRSAKTGGSSGIDTPATFCPESVHVVPGTISSSNPVVVVNSGTEKEMVFHGTWDEELSAHCPLTNHVIVHVAAKDDDDGSDLNNNADGGATEKTIPSLLVHPDGGVTADEKRRVLRAGGDAVDAIDGVIVPTAVLILQREK